MQGEASRPSADVLEARPAQPPLGRRIVVWGATGSGKTTFTRRLGAALGLEVVELDAIRHARGWDSTPWDDFRRILTERLDAAGPGWVSDGSYSPISDVYLSRADTLVWLHLPWRVSFWRLLKRTVGRARAKEPPYDEDGPRESWRRAFASRQSILWWSVSHYRTHLKTTRRRLARLPDGVPVHDLRTAEQVETFLAAASGSRRPPDA